MPFVVDEQPVGALGLCAAYPSLGVAVCARCPGGVLTGFTGSVALADRAGRRLVGWLAGFVLSVRWLPVPAGGDRGRGPPWWTRPQWRRPASNCGLR